MSAVATLASEEAEADTPKTYEVLKDGVMVSIVLGIGEDHKGKEVEITKSVVARKGDEFNNLSAATLELIEAGKLNDKFGEIDQYELEAREQEGEEADSDPEPKYADVKDYDGLSNDVLDEILAERAITDKVVGSGKDNSIVKQDRIKALIDNDKRASL